MSPIVKRAQALAALADKYPDPVQWLQVHHPELALLAHLFLVPRVIRIRACASIWKNRPPEALRPDPLSYHVVRVETPPRQEKPPQANQKRVRYPHQVFKVRALERFDQLPRIRPTWTPSIGNASNGSSVPHHPGVRFRVIGLKPHDWNPPREPVRALPEQGRKGNPVTEYQALHHARHVLGLE